MTKQITVLVFMMVFLVGTVSASSFGTYVTDKDRVLDGYTTTFEIKAMNLGTETLEVEVTSDRIDGADTRHDDTITMSPSVVTRNPGQYEEEEGQEWFLLDDERYVLVDKIPITFVADQIRDRNSFDFTVDLAARTADSDDGSTDDKVAPSQNVVQERSYGFSVRTSASSTDTGTETGGTADTDSSDDSSFSLPGGGYSGMADSVRDYSMDVFSDEQTDTDSSSEETEELDNWNTEDESLEGTESNEQDQENDSITGNFVAAATGNGITMVLLVGTMISFGYLMRVAV